AISWVRRTVLDSSSAMRQPIQTRSTWRLPPWCRNSHEPRAAAKQALQLPAKAITRVAPDRPACVSLLSRARLLHPVGKLQVAVVTNERTKNGRPCLQFTMLVPILFCVELNEQAMVQIA